MPAANWSSDQLKEYLAKHGRSMPNFRAGECIRIAKDSEHTEHGHKDEHSPCKDVDEALYGLALHRHSAEPDACRQTADATAVSAAGARVLRQRKYHPYRSKAENTAAIELLRLNLAGEIDWWQYEPITLVLAHSDVLRGCRYSPDFVFKKGETRTLVEVKGGYFRDDAVIKLKWTAEQICPTWGWKMELWMVRKTTIERITIKERT